MTPSYATNAPKGYMGDPRRGAALGRSTIGPDPRTMDELQADFVEACQRLDRALRLKEARPADGWKASAWEAAANAAREDKEEIRAHVKALEARQAAQCAPKVTLRRIRLNSGGYDPQGAYWGIGAPLYWAATDDGEYDATFRADDRDDAKATVREVYPNARFYR